METPFCKRFAKNHWIAGFIETNGSQHDGPEHCKFLMYFSRQILKNYNMIQCRVSLDKQYIYNILRFFAITWHYLGHKSLDRQCRVCDILFIRTCAMCILLFTIT